MSINDLVDAVVRCAKGHSMRNCTCFVKCGCGWSKDRGASGCRRCASIRFQKTGPSRYEAQVGRATVVTSRQGIHWTFHISAAPGEPLCGGHTLTNTNRNAQALGVYAAFRAQDYEGECR